MGVLDDAIREHLELKRRHGAEEEELRRQAEEALGPARREVAPAESEDGNGAEAAHADEPELSETIPPEALHSDVHAEEEITELAEDEPVATAPQVAPPEELQDEELHDEELHDEEIHEEELHGAHVDERQPELGETPPQGFGRVEEQGFERVEQRERVAHERVEEDEHVEEDELPAGDDFDELEDDDGHAEDDELGSEDEDADVLEDTPDFLQETPEHDRLWFEQKPPRDFDFD